ncbi:hypothetical protein MAPG_09768 [Magnaporthiopsis poae ATCC 64411]|uniref:Uncharacterized protein n=1 Tax=Magnaporthiopsis poae (strain ATCC 64411 / 73-15) TaxID=644358 RepID=A0A0C4EAT8_MAGP6|nr:hypothetical protein MAPG_09768 [Magnaporthiopsis poae ATCC 64411]
MDVYGAFQMSSIAILAAPVTLRRSTTYFDGPGRNIIFVWTGMLLAGMLGLAVEFFRSQPVPCAQEGITAANFPYGNNASHVCGIRCSQDDGPFSIMRSGSSGEIYVIPSPQRLSFGTATLLAAACCIISILSLVDIFNKIRRDNGKRYRDENVACVNHQTNTDGAHDSTNKGQAEGTIFGTNGATQSMMEQAETRAKVLMGAVEVPLFALAILALLVVGELNLTSRELSHGTEPMQNVGQWAPIVTAGLAAIGSLYLLWEKELHEYRKKKKSNRQPSNATAMTDATAPAFGTRRQSCTPCPHCQGHPESPTDAGYESPAGSPEPDGTKTAGGSRDKINEALSRFADFLATPHPGPQPFREGPAAAFPETPGERFKNYRLREDKTKYDDISRDRNTSRGTSIRSSMFDEDGEAPASPKTGQASWPPTAGRPSLSQSNRAPRWDGSLIPTLKIQEPSPSRSLLSRASTFPASSQAGPALSSAAERGRPITRRNTLEVPTTARTRSPSFTNQNSAKTRHD